MRNQGLSEKTINEHSRELFKFQNLGGNLKADEDEIIQFIKENYNEGSPQKIISSTLSKFRHYRGKPVYAIRGFLRQANADALLLQQKKNDKLKETLPTIDFKKMLNGYYRDKQNKNFVILYLLMNYNTRNQDLVLRVVKNESDLNQKENFIFIRDKDVVYIRNDYKTKERYGMKRDVIKAKKFFNSVQELDSLLLNNDNLDRQVKAVTGGINQSSMFKIMIATNNNLKSIAKASKNRGTNMNTIATNYDIT
jgi:site-specific recombinase XerC